jgi:hypothetical protein
VTSLAVGSFTRGAYDAACVVLDHLQANLAATLEVWPSRSEQPVPSPASWSLGPSWNRASTELPRVQVFVSGIPEILGLGPGEWEQNCTIAVQWELITGQHGDLSITDEAAQAYAAAIAALLVVQPELSDAVLVEPETITAQFTDAYAPVNDAAGRPRVMGKVEFSCRVAWCVEAVPIVDRSTATPPVPIGVDVDVANVPIPDPLT